MLAADKERERLFAKEKSLLNDKLADPSLLKKVYEQLEAIDAYSAPAKASSILSGLGFTTEMQSMTTKEFSGKWEGGGRDVYKIIIIISFHYENIIFLSSRWLENAIGYCSCIVL